MPEQSSAKADPGVVLRLLRAAGGDGVSREIEVSAHELATWRRDFLEATVVRLRCGVRGVEGQELKHTRVGELTMKLELV